MHCRPTSIPWYTSHVDGPGLGRSKMPGFSPPGPIFWALRDNVGHFWLKAGWTFLTFWAKGGKGEVSEGQEHLVWTPIGWIEAFEAIVVCPYRAPDPNTRPDMPQLCVPVQGLRVEVLACKCQTRGVRRCRPTSIPWYASHVNGQGLGRGYMPTFRLPQPI